MPTAFFFEELLISQNKVIFQLGAAVFILSKKQPSNDQSAVDRCDFALFYYFLLDL